MQAGHSPASLQLHSFSEAAGCPKCVLAANSIRGSPSACLLFPSQGCCLGGLQHSLMPPLC